MPAANILNAESLSSLIVSSLPKDASPQLKAPTDAIAIACHAGMLAVGFRLVGLGEDHSIEAHASPEDAQPLPQEWNASSTHAFRYKHAQSSMEHLLKVSRLGNKTVIHGMGMGDDKPADFHLTTKDFISESSLPATPASASTAVEDAKHSVQSIFISPSRLTDLGADLRVHIIQKLMPGLRKEGYEESTSTSTATQSQSQSQGATAQPSRAPYHEPGFDPLRDYGPDPARPHPLAAPRRPVPMGDFPPPGFEDEHQILQPPRGWPPRGGGGHPGYGERDLYPAGLGPNDPLRGGVGPGLRGGPGGGMHPTFDDSMFGGAGGGPGYDPQAPPGARYDPVGPGGAPPRGGGGGPRFGGMGGAPPNPFSGFGSGDFI